MINWEYLRQRLVTLGFLVCITYAMIHLRETQLNRFWTTIHRAKWQTSHFATHKHSMSGFRIHISIDQMFCHSRACLFSTADISCPGSVLLNRRNVLFLNKPFLHTQDLLSSTLSNVWKQLYVYEHTLLQELWVMSNFNRYYKEQIKKNSLSFMELSSMM
jgi:hypothetical protein